jgi:hypothetical protein
MAIHQFRKKGGKRGGRRAGRRPARRPAHRVPRSVGSTNDRGQMARIKETLEFNDLLSNTAYNFNFNLSQFARASALAPLFKWYKASYVEWRIEPTYNTFQEGTATNVSIPYLYVTMNRTQDNTGINLQDIQAMGAKGQKLTTLKKISYKPNWCSSGLNVIHFNSASALDNMATLGLKAQYSYLACPDTNNGLGNPSGFNPANPTVPAALLVPVGVIANQATYNGHSIIIDQEFGSGPTVGRVTCTVHWEFKDPHYTLAPTNAVQMLPLTN